MDTFHTILMAVILFCLLIGYGNITDQIDDSESRIVQQCDIAHQNE